MSPAAFVPPSLPQAYVERLVRQVNQLAPLIQQAEQMAHLQQEAAKFAKWLRPQWPVVQATLRQMAELNSTAAILARQRETMAAIQSGFIDTPLPTPAELEEARASLQQYLPETP
jgi:3-methyladenine DNA glycosylase Tag